MITMLGKRIPTNSSGVMTSLVMDILVTQFQIVHWVEIVELQFQVSLLQWYSAVITLAID